MQCSDMTKTKQFETKSLEDLKFVVWGIISTNSRGGMLITMNLCYKMYVLKH